MHKSEIMFKLYTTGKIRNIQYRLYFNSCNLEHVLYNELKDFSDDEKEILSDEFAEEYEGKILEFIEFISDKSFAVDGTYRETWKYIEKDMNSLQRHSNMHLFLQQIRQNLLKQNKGKDYSKMKNNKNNIYSDSSNACSNTGISVCTGILCC